MTRPMLGSLRYGAAAPTLLAVVVVWLPASSSADHEALLANHEKQIATHHEENEEAAPATKAWDGQAVARLAEDLRKQTEEARQAFRRTPAYTDPALNEKDTAMEFENLLRNIERLAEKLASKAAAGADAKSTSYVVREIASQLHSAEVQGRRMANTKWTKEELRPAMQSLDELAAYYGAGPFFEIDESQPSERL